jgi:hypothetical protein
MDVYMQRLKQYRSVSAAASLSGENSLTLTRQIELLSAETQKAFKRSLMLMTSSAGTVNNGRPVHSEAEEHRLADRKRRAISRIHYYEDLDYLICAAHDGNLCTDLNREVFQNSSRIDVMGYDKTVFATLMTSAELLLSLDEGLEANDSKNDRVAGLTLQHVLRGHKGSVTCFIVVHDRQRHWLVSSFLLRTESMTQ